MPLHVFGLCVRVKCRSERLFGSGLSIQVFPHSLKTSIPLTNISRLLFIATPLRGSSAAAGQAMSTAEGVIRRKKRNSPDFWDAYTSNYSNFLYRSAMTSL